MLEIIVKVALVAIIYTEFTITTRINSVLILHVCTAGPMIRYTVFFAAE